MTTEEKKEFVRLLTDNIARSICNKIDDGSIPDDWNGGELRSILAMHFNDEITPAMRDRRSKRYKDFQNTVLTNNI